MEKNFNLSLDGIQCDQMYNNKKSPNFAQKLPQNSHNAVFQNRPKSHQIF